MLGIGVSRLTEVIYSPAGMREQVSVDLRVQLLCRRRLRLRLTAPGSLLVVIAALAIWHTVPARTTPHPVRSSAAVSSTHPQATGAREINRCAP